MLFQKNVIKAKITNIAGERIDITRKSVKREKTVFFNRGKIHIKSKHLSPGNLEIMKGGF